MINQNGTIGRQFQLATDLVLTALAFHSASLIPAVVPFEPHFKVIPEALYSRTLTLILLTWTVLLLLFSRAGQYRMQTAGFLARQVLRIVTVGISVLVFLFFVFGHSAQICPTAVLFAAFDFILLFSSRYILLKMLEHFRRNGYNTLRILVVGSTEQAEPVFEQALRHPQWGIKPVGFVDWDKPKWLWGYRLLPLAGLYEHLPVILTGGRIDAVLFSDIPSNPKKFRDSSEICRRIGVTSFLLAGVLTGWNENQPTTSAGPLFLGWPVIRLSDSPSLPFGVAAKYAFARLRFFASTIKGAKQSIRR